jgi:hypothetical protein
MKHENVPATEEEIEPIMADNSDFKYGTEEEKKLFDFIKTDQSGQEEEVLESKTDAYV